MAANLWWLSTVNSEPPSHPPLSSAAPPLPLIQVIDDNFHILFLFSSLPLSSCLLTGIAS